MTTNAHTGIELWIDDDELEEISLAFERIVVRSRQRPVSERPEFYAEYLEVE